MTFVRAVFLASFAALVVAAVPARAADDALTPAQRREVGTIVHEYLRQHPEVLLDAIQALRDKEEAKARETTRTALKTRRDEIENDPATPFTGNPKGDVTVVEFFDYRCGYCKRAFPAIQAMLKDDGKIRFVFKEFPILGPQSQAAARASLAVWKTARDKYMLFHTALMTAHGALPESRVLDFARKAGIDVPALQKAMKDPQINRDLARNFALAKALNITGTPAFIIDDNLIPGAVDAATLRHLVEQVRKQARKES